MRKAVTIALFWAVSVPLAAQSPDQRDSIVELRAALDSVVDFDALVVRESLTVDSARIDRDNPMIHIRLGFINYRLGELSDSVESFYDAAASEFEWARDLRPDWPYPHYGLGLSELALGEHSMIAVENLRQILGIDHLSKAARAFAAAAERDPSFIQAVLDLAAAASQQRINARMDVAMEALRAAAQTDAGDNPDLQLALGRMARDLDQMDSALVAFNKFLRVGGDSSIGLLERARTEFAIGRIPSAQRDYYAGAELASPEAVRLYRKDIEWIGTPEELAEYDDLAGAGMHLWLRTFWERREARDLRLPGERMREHFNRYFYARANYRLLTRHRHYDIIERFRSEQDEVDDRGVIYIRHGPPDREAVYNSANVEPNVSWEYQFPDGQRIFHFVASGDVSDYKLVESLVDVYGFSGAMAIRTGDGSVQLDRELFASRGRFNSMYQRLSSPSSASFTTDLTNERAQGEHAIEFGTTTDSYAHRFSRDLEPVVERAVVAAEEDLPPVALVSFAVPGSQLEVREGPLGLAYIVSVRLSAMLDGERQIAFVDTTFTYRVGTPMRDGQFIQDMMYVELDPGSYVFHFMVQDAVSAAGAITELDTVFVPGGLIREPAVGDLVAGYPGWGLRWEMGSDTIYMNPTNLYPDGSTMDIHYELYGLPRGTSYEAKLEVKKRRGGSVFGFVSRLFGGGGGKISVEFPGVADGDLTSVGQTVDLEPLDPGEYQVKLTVELDNGVEFSRETAITILEQ